MSVKNASGFWGRGSDASKCVRQNNGKPDYEYLKPGHVSQTGGITPVRKLAVLCQAFGVGFGQQKAESFPLEYRPHEWTQNRLPIGQFFMQIDHAKSDPIETLFRDGVVYQRIKPDARPLHNFNHANAHQFYQRLANGKAGNAIFFGKHRSGGRCQVKFHP